MTHFFLQAYLVNVMSGENMSHSRNNTDSEPHPQVSVPFTAVLAELLRLLTPVVLSMVTSQFASPPSPSACTGGDKGRGDSAGSEIETDTDPADGSGGDGDGIGAEASAESMPSPLDTGQALLSDVYFLQWNSYRRCILTHRRSDSVTDTQTALLEVVSDCNKEKNTHPVSDIFSVDGLGGVALADTSVLGLHDIWINCLKVVVNLSHKAPTAILSFSECGLIRDLSAALRVFAKWRCDRETPHRHTQAAAGGEQGVHRGLLDVSGCGWLGCARRCVCISQSV